MLEFNKRNARAWSMMGASGVLGIVANDIAENDDRFAVVTADLCFFSGLDRMKSQHPDKLVNVGIAEQNMIGVAAGMAKEGMRVFASTYASFAATRVMDQVNVCMGYMGLPVVLVGLTSGFSVGVLGATHMSISDLAIMRAVPNIVVLSPADCFETAKCLYAALECKQPTYVRLSGTQRVPIVYSEDYDFILGKAVLLEEGSDILLVATGAMVHTALQVSKSLSEKGISSSVLNIHTIKPFDGQSIQEHADGKRLVVSIEEHSIFGGLGSATAEVLSQRQGFPPLVRIGVNDYYPHAGSYERCLYECGLTAEQIEEQIMLHLL